MRPDDRLSRHTLSGELIAMLPPTSTSKVHLNARLKMLSLGATASVLAALVATAPASSAGSAAAAARPVVTNFGMEHHAFGTKVDKNPALASGATANSIIGCTTLAGLVRHNSVAGVNAAPLVTASEVKSRGVTAKQDGVVSVTSRNTITRGSLLGGEVRFRGLSSQSRTWHDSSGLHNRITMDLARLVIEGNPVALSGGMEQFDVAGLGTLTVFQRWTRNTATEASARGVVLRLVLNDGTRVRVGHSYSHMFPRIYGPMSGSTWGSLVKIGGNTVTSGKTAFQVMPCRGTGGNVRENTSAGITLPGVVETDLITTHVRGVQKPRTQRGYTQAQIAEATLGAAGVHLTGIQSKANVTRSDGTLSRNAKGTRLLTLTVGAIDIRDQLTPGEPFNVPELGTITFKKVTKIPNGIDVVAVEVVLLDNTVIELGHSIMRIKKN